MKLQFPALRMVWLCIALRLLPGSQAYAQDPLSGDTTTTTGTSSSTSPGPSTTTSTTTTSNSGISTGTTYPDDYLDIILDPLAAIQNGTFRYRVVDGYFRSASRAGGVFEGLTQEEEEEILALLDLLYGADAEKIIQANIDAGNIIVVKDFFSIPLLWQYGDWDLTYNRWENNYTLFIEASLSPAEMAHAAMEALVQSLSDYDVRNELLGAEPALIDSAEFQLYQQGLQTALAQGAQIAAILASVYVEGTVGILGGGSGELVLFLRDASEGNGIGMAMAVIPAAVTLRNMRFADELDLYRWADDGGYLAKLDDVNPPPIGTTSRAAELGIDVENLSYTVTAASHLDRPYMNSSFLIEQIIEAAPPIPDTGGSGAPLTNGLKWIVPGSYRGAPGTYDLVIDMDNGVIVHFVFKSN